MKFQVLFFVTFFFIGNLIAQRDTVPIPEDSIDYFNIHIDTLEWKPYNFESYIIKKTHRIIDISSERISQKGIYKNLTMFEFSEEKVHRYICKYNDDPIKILIKIESDFTFNYLINIYASCDSSLNDDELRKMYFTMLKDYNKEVLGISNFNTLQALSPNTTIKNKQYIWFVNLAGLQIQKDKVINELNGKAKATDLLTSYNNGEVKFIKIERISQ